MKDKGDVEREREREREREFTCFFVFNGIGKGVLMAPPWSIAWVLIG
jgi:hypothetical protein